MFDKSYWVLSSSMIAPARAYITIPLDSNGFPDIIKIKAALGIVAPSHDSSKQLTNLDIGWFVSVAPSDFRKFLSPLSSVDSASRDVLAPLVTPNANVGVTQDSVASLLPPIGHRPFVLGEKMHRH